MTQPATTNHCESTWKLNCQMASKPLQFTMLLQSSHVSHRRLKGAVQPFWMAPGLTSLHCISARLVVSF